MDADPLTVLRLVKQGPCHELDSQPFWRLRTVKEKGWIEPYFKTVMPGYGPSTKWQLSPSGRAELKRLEAEDQRQREKASGGRGNSITPALTAAVTADD